VSPMCPDSHRHDLRARIGSGSQRPSPGEPGTIAPPMGGAPAGAGASAQAAPYRRCASAGAPQPSPQGDSVPLSPARARTSRCYPCARTEVLPMSPVAHLPSSRHALRAGEPVIPGRIRPLLVYGSRLQSDPLVRDRALGRHVMATHDSIEGKHPTSPSRLRGHESGLLPVSTPVRAGFRNPPWTAYSRIALFCYAHPLPPDPLLPESNAMNKLAPLACMTLVAALHSQNSFVVPSANKTLPGNNYDYEIFHYAMPAQQPARIQLVYSTCGLSHFLSAN